MQNTDDPRLNNLVKEGKEGEIVIVGVPFGYSRKRTLNKGGEQNGPCCLRRFFHKVGPLFNPEHQIDISGIKLSDYGNIDIDDKENSTAPERSITKISDEIVDLVKNMKIPFVFGGAKQGTYGASLAFSKVYAQHRHILIAGRPTLKRPYDENKLSSDCLMTMLLKDRPHLLTLFGTAVQYFPKQYEKNFDLISYQDIRKAEWSQGQLTFTQAGFIMNNFLGDTKEQVIHVTLSVEAIQRFRGCRDVIALGLTVQEIMDIFMLLGRSKKVCLVDIAEFNPSVEDYESSLLILNMLYYFLMGWTKREQ